MSADAPAAPPDWRTLIDEKILLGWMDAEGVGSGPIEDAELLAGGTQNILLRFRRSGHDLVLRRPPVALRANSNETIRREAQLLAALRYSDVPCPALVAACADESILGTCFYLMETVNGFNPRYELPPPHRHDPAIRRRMGLALAEGIARLSHLDHVKLGLSDFGRIEGFLERQTDRWSRQLGGYADLRGWPGPDDLGDVSAVRGWLEKHRPASFRPGILHGDYHLSNVMFRPDSGELAAIIDWELATIGAPLLDLGWLVATWPPPSGEQTPGVIGTAPWEGFPTAAELVSHYQRVSGHTADGIEWYSVLACYKLAVLLEGTYARACAGKADRATGDRLHSAAIALMARAGEWTKI
jgi:aminoglycoside phosphotransferase (APT) family kinase protein